MGLIYLLWFALSTVEYMTVLRAVLLLISSVYNVCGNNKLAKNQHGFKVLKTYQKLVLLQIGVYLSIGLKVNNMQYDHFKNRIFV